MNHKLKNLISNIMSNKILISFFVFVLCAFETVAQKGLVDILIPGTVLIKYTSGGSSSGVIVADSSYMYLVTAKHCLIEEPQKGRINLVDSMVFLIYYVHDPFSSKPDSLIVNLLIAQKQGDLLYDPLNDIAILVIAKMNGYTPSGNPKFIYTSSTNKLTKLAPGGISEDLCLNFDKVNVGEDCLILGYPSSLQLNNINDYDFQRPLLRKGAIAGKDKSKGTIIVDCPSYQGNSGGPVVSSSLLDQSSIGLIGIVSRSILHVEQLESNYYKTVVSVNLNNSGYTVIIPIDFALSLMKARSTH